MRTHLLRLLLVAALAPASAISAPDLTGTPAPALEATASLAGRPFHFSLARARGEGPVVVYFYPAAYTRGCNVQAHEFAVNEARFRAAGASIVGVSLDGIDRLNRFSADPEYCGGKVPVASDPGGAIARAWGVGVRAAGEGRRDTNGDAIDHDLADRTTFVVSADGRVAAVIGGLAPQDNVAQALAAVRGLGR